MRALSVVLIGVAGLLVAAQRGSVAEAVESMVPEALESTSASFVGAIESDPLPTAARTVSPASDRRIERALQNRWACLGCHRIGDDGGAIGPTLNGLSERVDIDHVLSMIVDPDGTVPGTLMPRQTMPEREARRLAEYLMTRTAVGSDAPVQPEPPRTLGADEAEDGAALYARHCASCHGTSGNGDGWNAPTLPVPPTAHSDAALMSNRADDTLYDGIAAGAWVLDGSPRMPAFAELLTPDQIRALVRHIRSLCDCEGPAWSRGDVE